MQTEATATMANIQGMLIYQGEGGEGPRDVQGDVEAVRQEVEAVKRYTNRQEG